MKTRWLLYALLAVSTCAVLAHYAPGKHSYQVVRLVVEAQPWHPARIPITFTIGVTGLDRRPPGD